MSISNITKMAICAFAVALLLITIFPATTTSQDLEVDGLVPEPQREWTFMVYMDGDNNLEGAGVEDFNEMEFAFKQSTNEVNVVVQFDRIAEFDTSNGDWEDCKRYAIQKDYDKDVMTSEVVQEMGEVNMGDPDTLVDFVKWSFKYYPAKQYALVLWDHGGAYRGICWDDTDLTEEGDADCITLPELRGALREIKQARGYRNLEIVGFDACSMAQVGVLYEIQEYADIVLASGFVEPGDGWPYERILPKLLSQPTMDKHKLAEIIAQEFQASYSDREDDPQDSPRTTMTAFNMTMFPQLVQVMNEFSVELSKIAGDRYENIMFARSRALSYDMVPIGPFTFTNYCLTDLTDFCMKIIDDPQIKFNNMELTRIAQTVIDAQESCTVASYAYPPLETTATAKKANGLTVYFPNNIDTPWDTRYDVLKFKHDMFWDNFLQEHWFEQRNAANTPPSCVITFPGDTNETINQDDLFIPVTGTAFDDETVDKVLLAIDDDNWTEVELSKGESEEWFYNLPVDELSPGHHTIKARAVDEKDNKSPIYATVVYVEKGADDDSGDTGIAFNFNYLVVAVMISLVILGVAILIRDRKKKYKSQ